MDSKKAPKKNTPAVLIVMDGWGVGPDDYSNAIHVAKTPNFDSYVKTYPYSELAASGESVGLHKRQDGNSEAGHLNIGAGRIVEQDSVIISKAISDGIFFKNPAFMQAAKHAKKYDSNVHLMGLLSNGQSAHSHPDHLVALITFFRYQKVKNIYLHLFTDGRDSHRFEGIKFLRKYHTVLHSHAKVATIIGRAYAMDRKKDWNHTRVAYEAMVEGKAEYEASSAEEAVLNAYNRGESDEFVKPTIITKNGNPIATIDDGDSVVFFNLRSDRARQLAKPFTQTDFEKHNAGAFKRNVVRDKLFFVAMTDFGPDLDNILTAFPSRDIPQTLPMALFDYRQLYVAESEKYAHMTYFFNGGYDKPIAGEERKMFASPDVLSYVDRPEMALKAVTDYVVASVENENYDFIGANFSNADMIAHTGNLVAAVKAIEFIDESLHRVVSAVLKKNGVVFITADHGNAEEMIDRTNGEFDTDHSKNLVPFIIVSETFKGRTLRKNGILGDVAPTILHVLGVPQPRLMTGQNLLT